jgi:hypothetical protein
MTIRADDTSVTATNAAPALSAERRAASRTLTNFPGPSARECVRHTLPARPSAANAG